MFAKFRIPFPYRCFVPSDSIQDDENVFTDGQTMDRPDDY